MCEEKKVYLFNENQNLDSFLKKNMHLPIKWMYLGKNIIFCLDLEKKYGDKISRIYISEILQKTAKKYRQEYIDFIGKQAHLNNESWWLTAVSERNNYISNVFLYICYLKISIKLIKENKENLLIISESDELLELVSNYCKKNHFNYYMPENKGKNNLINGINFSFRYIFSRSKFITQYILKIIASRFYNLIKHSNHKPYEDSSFSIIQTWVDNRFFIENNKYSDVFFRFLKQFLKENKKNTLYVIDILPTIFYLKAILKLIKIDEFFILRESNITITDIFKSIFFVKKNLNRLKIEGNIYEFNFEKIIREEIKKEFLETRAEHSYLIYLSSKRISVNYHINKYIYLFENHMWEKMLLRGFREVSKNTEFIAYAHPVVNPTYTCYSVSKYEKDLIPLPNKIVTNGFIGKQILTDSGFDANKIFIGSALRFSNIYNNFHSLKKNNEEKRILIACSANIYETIETIIKSIAAFNSEKDLEVLIKLHPNVKKSVILKFISKLPSNFRIVEDSIDSLLTKSSVTIYTSSSVCLESVIRDIPVIHIKSDYIIDMNPFEGCDIFKSVSTPEELKKTATQIMYKNLIVTDEMKDIAEQHFTRSTIKKLSIFL